MYLQLEEQQRFSRSPSINGWPPTADIHINDNFAKLSESLFIADRHAREEVRQRALMQQNIEKQKASKEESLRLLAQRAREERGRLGAPSSAAPSARPGAMKSALGGYGSGSESASGSGSKSEGGGDEEDEEAARIRDEMRRKKRQQREREMRMSNMGQGQRAKHFARKQNRDILEKIALGLAKPTVSYEYARLPAVQSRINVGLLADEESYNLYDEPLFHGSSASAAIYTSRGNMGEANDELYGGGTEEGVAQALSSDRFGLGPTKLGKGLGMKEGLGRRDHRRDQYNLRRMLA